MTNYQKPIRELFLIICLSAAFRGYMILAEGMDWVFISSSIHGIISDLSLPFAITALALYQSTGTAIGIASWVNFFIANLICFDFLFFRFFQLRLCDRCFDADIMLDFQVSQRAQFAAAVLVMVIVFRLAAKNITTRQRKPGRKQLWCIMFSALIVLGIGNLQAPPSESLPTQSWDDYFRHFSFIKRSHLSRSSISALLSLSYYEQAVFPVVVFLDSPFFQYFLDSYDEVAYKNMESGFFANMPTVWLHMQNSSEGAIKSLTDGIDGIEVDVNFFPAQDNFFICHDLPLHEDLSSYETLENFLKSLEMVITPHQYVWLDVKQLQETNPKISVPKLKAIIENCRYKERIIIESKNQFIVRMLSNHGLNTIWGALYGNSYAKLDDYLVDSIKSMAILSGCKMISLPFNVYDETAAKMLASFPIALYTINDPEKLQLLAPYGNIRVLLTDDKTLATSKR